MFATPLLFIYNFTDLEQCLYKTLLKKEDTRSAMTNFGKEEVLKIRQGILGTLNIIKWPG